MNGLIWCLGQAKYPKEMNGGSGESADTRKRRGLESEGSILAGSVGKQPSQDLRQPFCADDSLRARAVWKEG